MSLLVAGRAITFGNNPRMDQSIFNNVGSFADCCLHFLTIDSLNSFCGELPALVNLMHGSGMCQLRSFRIINSSTQKLGIQRLGKLHPARMFFNSVSCRFSCRGSFSSKHTCLDIQTPPETVFGPQKHTQNTFSGGVWMSRLETPGIPPSSSNSGERK